MKQLHIRSQRVAWLFGLALFTAACDNPNPVSPSGSEAIAPLGARMTLCHRTGNGTYSLIEVSGAAMAAHLAHGDEAPNNGRFSATCALLPSVPPPPPVPPPPDPVPPPPLPPTLSCGAPAGATHPGSTVFPGPTVDATSGVSLEFAVTLSPAPTGTTWMVREVRDSLATGLTVRQSTVALTDGRYQGSIFTSGGLTFVREIRFTVDNLSCSLFWNINP